MRFVSLVLLAASAVSGAVTSADVKKASADVLVVTDDVGEHALRPVFSGDDCVLYKYVCMISTSPRTSASTAATNKTAYPLKGLRLNDVDYMLPARVLEGLQQTEPGRKPPVVVITQYAGGVSSVSMSLGGDASFPPLALDVMASHDSKAAVFFAIVRPLATSAVPPTSALNQASKSPALVEEKPPVHASQRPRNASPPLPPQSPPRPILKASAVPSLDDSAPTTTTISEKQDVITFIPSTPTLTTVTSSSSPDVSTTNVVANDATLASTGATAGTGAKGGEDDPFLKQSIKKLKDFGSVKTPGRGPPKPQREKGRNLPKDNEKKEKGRKRRPRPQSAPTVVVDTQQHDESSSQSDLTDQQRRQVLKEAILLRKPSPWPSIRVGELAPTLAGARVIRLMPQEGIDARKDAHYAPVCRDIVGGKLVSALKPYTAHYHQYLVAHPSSLVIVHVGSGFFVTPRPAQGVDLHLKVKFGSVVKSAREAKAKKVPGPLDRLVTDVQILRVHKRQSAAPSSAGSSPPPPTISPYDLRIFYYCEEECTFANYAGEVGELKGPAKMTQPMKEKSPTPSNSSLPSAAVLKSPSTTYAAQKSALSLTPSPSSTTTTSPSHASAPLTSTVNPPPKKLEAVAELTVPRVRAMSTARRAKEKTLASGSAVSGLSSAATATASSMRAEIKDGLDVRAAPARREPATVAAKKHAKGSSRSQAKDMNQPTIIKKAIKAKDVAKNVDGVKNIDDKGSVAKGANDGKAEEAKPTMERVEDKSDRATVVSSAPKRKNMAKPRQGTFPPTTTLGNFYTRRNSADPDDESSSIKVGDEDSDDSEGSEDGEDGENDNEKSGKPPKSRADANNSRPHRKPHRQ
jgi:hypothetical protein